ncbi:TPA: flagellar export protein FliJ [bacterium]|nr:flagellar export protein FliJ [bacterium]
MPRFKFKLERVFEVRKHKEELLKNELAAVRRDYTHEESIFRELIMEHREHLDQIRKRQTSPDISCEEMLWYYAYLKHLNNRIERQNVRLQELRRKIEEVKERLIKASQERRVLERLRERRLEEFKLEQEKIEQAFLDEIALSMYLRGASQLSCKR